MDHPEPLALGAVEWTPSACTLPTEEQPLRVAEFDRLFAGALRGIHRTGDTSLTLEFAVTPAQRADLEDLIRRETECCSFFSFTVEAGRLLQVHITVPPAQTAVLTALARRATHLSTPGTYDAVDRSNLGQ
jgi:hypothetical protein